MIHIYIYVNHVCIHICSYLSSEVPSPLIFIALSKFILRDTFNQRKSQQIKFLLLLDQVLAISEINHNLPLNCLRAARFAEVE